MEKGKKELLITLPEGTCVASIAEGGNTISGILSVEMQALAVKADKTFDQTGGWVQTAAKLLPELSPNEIVYLIAIGLKETASLLPEGSNNGEE